ncbi:Cytochrome P450 71A25 [Bienertia sinuspersici]
MLSLFPWSNMVKEPVDLLFLHALSILPFFLGLFFLYKWLCFDAAMRRDLPPSPPKLPILGNLHQLGIYPHQTLQSFSRQYGELMLLHLGSKPALVVSSAKAAREVMKTHDIVFSNRPQSIISKRLIYNRKNVAGAPYGEYWRQMKSICVLQLLSSKRVRSFHDVREEEVTVMMAKIRKSKSAVNLSEIFMTFTNDVICRVAFGRKYSGEKDGAKFKELLREFVELLGTFTVSNFIPWLAWVDQLNGLHNKMNKLAKEFDEFLERIVEEHMARQSNKKHNRASEGELKDFVDVLLQAQMDSTAGFPISRDSIKALILDMFAGGTDTTYTVLEWAMTELLRHPTIMKKLQEEVRGITTGQADVSEDDLEKMKYLKAVIKETLRLHPPIPLLVPRESTQDVIINGYHIAAGTRVITNAWAIHRDPATWEKPEEFHPERFLKSSIDFKGQDFELIPFGSGRRGCPGILFAIASNELVLANLLCKFNWSLPGEQQSETLDMTQRTGLTIHRKVPLLASHNGYGELMLLHFGRNPVLIVSSAEAASEIMKTHDAIFSDRPALAMFKRLLYDCKDIATAPYGDYWRRMRSICVFQLLSYKRVQSFHNVREEEVAQMIEEIGRSPTTVNLSKVFANFSSDVICRVAFGMKFNGEKNGINFKELQEKQVELVGRINVGDFIPWLACVNHVNGMEREIKKVSKDMNKFLEEIVQEHLDKSNRTQSIHQGIDDEEIQDFVDVLLELQQDKSAKRASKPLYWYVPNSIVATLLKLSNITILM